MLTRLLAASVVVIALAAAWWPALPMAQSPPMPATAASTQGLKRTLLHRFDVAGANHETVINIVELSADAEIGRHTHYGIEAGYVLEGEATNLVDGEAPRQLKPGDSFLIQAGVAHSAKAGPKGVKVITTHVVEKGKAFATPMK